MQDLKKEQESLYGIHGNKIEQERLLTQEVKDIQIRLAQTQIDLSIAEDKRNAK